MMNDEVLRYFHVRGSLFPVHYSKLPCGIMVVRQILALNVRVRILAGQRVNIEQGISNDSLFIPGHA